MHPSTPLGWGTPPSPTHLGTHPEPNMFVACLNLFIIFNGFEHLAQTQHSLKNSSGAPLGPSVFFTDPIRIILNIIQLKISHEKSYTLASLLYKRTRLMSYKYPMNPSNSRFTISLFLIFQHKYFQSLSL